MLKSTRASGTRGQSQNLPPVLVEDHFVGSTHLTTGLGYALTMYLDPATSSLYSFSSRLVPQLPHTEVQISHAA